MNQFFKKCGFTSTELLVAITLSFILIAVIYSAYHFSLRYPKIWNDKVNLENTALLCMERLNQDFIVADEVRIIEDRELILKTDARTPVIYQFEDDRLFRNGVLLNEPPVRLLNFQYRPLETVQKDSSHFSSDIIEGEQKKIWMFEMVFGNAGSRFSIETCISPRRMNPMRGILTPAESGQ